MFEIGDDLPTLGASPERLALVKNTDLINMARLGRASFPADLMTYAAADLQPSVFLLKEDNRQSILTIFNWSEGELKRDLELKSLGLKEAGEYQITEVFGDQNCCSYSAATINFTQPAHSVHVFKLIDKAVPETTPTVEINAPSQAKSGDSLAFSAAASPAGGAVLTCRWDFGDGSAEEGMHVQHTYTGPGEYHVQVTALGLVGATSPKTVTVTITGEIPKTFIPAEKKRLE